MKVLITGGAGYIGSRLVSHLLKPMPFPSAPLFTSVTVLDNFMWDNYHSLNSYHAEKRFSVIKGDIRTFDDWSSYGAVVHLAAIVGAKACDQSPMLTQQINADATERMVDYLPDSTRLIYLNTNSGYGRSNEKVCTEESPLEPVSLYGRTKVAGEEHVLRHPNSMVMRLATVFGLSPRMRYDLMVNDFVRRAYFDRQIAVYEGHFRRNFVHIDDVCRAIKFFLYDYHTGVYNLGNDDINCSKRELAEKIVAQLNQPASIIDMDGKDPDQRDYNVSSRKIRDTGFRCKYDLKTGIRQLLSHYRCFNGEVTYADIQNSIPG